MKLVYLVFLAGNLAIGGAAAAAAPISQPTFNPLETEKKAYGRASYDFRNTQVTVDYWWVGHDSSDSPFAANRDMPGYTAQSMTLPPLPLCAGGNENMDRHACGFLHLDDDGLIDMVCSVGADMARGFGCNEVYKNTSRDGLISMERMPQGTGIEDMYGSGRAMVPFHFANGKQGIWSVTSGVDRPDDDFPNINRLYEYNGSGTFKFTLLEAPWTTEQMSSCAVAGDLNGDKLDDLLLCRPDPKDASKPGSILYLQNAQSKFVETPLTTNSKRFVTAEIADVLHKDKVNELIVSVEKTVGGVKFYYIEIYEQLNHKLKAKPTVQVPMTGRVNSIAIGDLDGDGEPDIYAAISIREKCEKTRQDIWRDVVLSTVGAPEGSLFKRTEIDEPADKGCSWLATWGGTGIIHLSRGTEGMKGTNYWLQF